MKSVLLYITVAVAFGLCCATAKSPPYYNIRVRVVPGNASASLTPRIHGGIEAKDGQFKHMVFILGVYSGLVWFTCSASLINQDWVITAAHCVPKELGKYPKVFAVMGRADVREYYNARSNTPLEKPIDENALGVQERSASEIHVNPKYSVDTLEADIALLKMNKPFILVDNLATIPLSKEKIRSRKSCSIMGWGLNDHLIQSFKLMYADGVKAQTPEQYCKYVKAGPFICLEQGGPGICQGDSGSPLICEGKVWGISSFALSPKEDATCIDPQEEYYAEIYPELNWINLVTNTSPSRSLNPVQVFVLSAGILAWVLRA